MARSKHYAVEATGNVVTWVSYSYDRVSDAEQVVSDLDKQREYQAGGDERRYEMYTDYMPTVGMDIRDIPFVD
jgi:hypothetical protein